MTGLGGGLSGIDPHWLWLGGGLLLAIAEMIAPGFFLIWLALAALVTGLATWVVPMADWAQVALFVELALVTVLMARRWVRDGSQPVGVDPLINDRAARLVGQTVIVTQAIVDGEGRVGQGDGAWLARGPDASAGERMRIVGSEGTVLMVEPAMDEAMLAALDVACDAQPRAPYSPQRSYPMTDKIELSDAEWREKLSPEQYQVLRQAGTERAFTGKYDKNKAAGEYLCAGCGEPLFSSDDKFNSGSGWPSYSAPVSADAVHEERDVTHGMVRTEVRCAKCEGHLGHVFPDGPGPEGLRYCINSASLEFQPKD